MSAGQNADDGTREAAVRELGEDAVRALEVEVVKANADRLSLGTFVAMGIPTASILEGLGCEPGSSATRRESSGLSVRARGRLDQAVAWSRGRICYREPATGASGEVSGRIEASPAGPGRTHASPAVTVTRHTDGSVALQLNNQDRPIPVTDTHVADVLGVELETWVRSRDSIEKALAAVAGARPPLKPDSTRRPHRPEELSTTSPVTPAPGPGLAS
ncbi:hypothetical protein BJ993_005002 [Nocardioides aromaticivorans]|uniref:Uncharacterized protein n=1 Tax=Nocardioides aromaticivorans TaxID=200618 RepID=A0A7Y9ZN05_9ACTN|nr:hypothetical protein [Nocardioides aromaticivorans]